VASASVAALAASESARCTPSSGTADEEREAPAAADDDAADEEREAPRRGGPSTCESWRSSSRSASAESSGDSAADAAGLSAYGRSAGLEATMPLADASLCRGHARVQQY